MSLNDNDIKTILFKKYNGYVNSNTSTSIATESNINALTNIYSNQILSNKIPSSAPDITKLDDTTVFTKTLVTGIKDGANNAICRYESVEYKHISYYKNIVLQENPVSPNTSFAHDVLKKTIFPLLGSYPNKYNILLEYFKNNNWFTISTTDYILDRDAGVVTIYTNNYNRSEHGLPRISFWRYEGKTLDETLTIATINESNTCKLPIAGISGESFYKFENITVSGNGDVNAVSFNTTSDINTKTNIHNLSTDSSLALITKLRPVEYNFKNNLDKKRFGFIAQDVATLLGGENVGLHHIGSDGIQSLNYSELIAPMISVLQQLYKENQELTKRVKALEDGFVYNAPIEEISEATDAVKSTEKQKKKGVSRFIPFLRKK